MNLRKIIREQIEECFHESLGKKMQNDSKYLKGFKIKKDSNKKVVFQKKGKNVNTNSHSYLMKVIITNPLENKWIAKVKLKASEYQEGYTTVETNEGYDRFIEMIDNNLNNNPLWSPINLKNDMVHRIDMEIINLIKHLLEKEDDIINSGKETFKDLKTILKIVKKFDIRFEADEIIKALEDKFYEKHKVLLALQKIPQLDFYKNIKGLFGIR